MIDDRIRALVAGKGNNSDDIRETLRRARIIPIILSRTNR